MIDMWMWQVLKVEEDINHIFTKVGLMLKWILHFQIIWSFLSKDQIFWVCTVFYFSGMALSYTRWSLSQFPVVIFKICCRSLSNMEKDKVFQIFLSNVLHRREKLVVYLLLKDLFIVEDLLHLLVYSIYNIYSVNAFVKYLVFSSWL